MVDRDDKRPGFLGSWDLLALPVVLTVMAGLYMENCRLEDKLAVERQQLNITGEACPDYMIFNRVPKVGSQTINSLIAALRQRNNFSAYTSLDGMPKNFEGETPWIPDPTLRNFTMTAIDKQAKPFAFLKHQNFLDFSETSIPFPIYINFVRNPVERIISWYYYVRAPWYQFEQLENGNDTINVALKHGHITLRELKVPIEDCFEKRMRGCVLHDGMTIHGSPALPPYASQMAFFCGHTPECDVFNSDKLLAIAKKNVERHFAVVGVLEDMGMSLQVLEAYIPRYFAGAREAMAAEEKLQHVNKNIYKPKTSKKLKQWLKQKLSKEMEFFWFCRQRLKKQFLALQQA